MATRWQIFFSFLSSLRAHQLTFHGGWNCWWLWHPLFTDVAGNIPFLLFFWFLPQGMWDPSSLPEIEPTPSVLEGEVSTTGLPGNSPVIQFDSQTSVAQETWQRPCREGISLHLVAPSHWWALCRQQREVAEEGSSPVLRAQLFPQNLKCNFTCGQIV